VIVDVHSHNLLPQHWGPEHKKHWEPVYGKPYPVVTPESFDAEMRKAGVDVAIVFGLAATAAGIHTPNDYVARFCAEAQTPTIALTALDPTDPDWREQLEEAVGFGFKGVKLYPVLSLFDPMDERFDEFYRWATAHELVLLWHMGATPSPRGRLAISQPLVVEEVARRHPDLKQIMAHMGHPWQRDANVVLRKHKNVFADVSASWSRPMDGFLALVHAQEWGVTEKLLFGSDYPLWTPSAAIAGFRELATFRAGNLPYVRDETIESILHRDALAVLGLPDPRAGRASHQ
jgi:hypothetical protein